MLTPQIRFLSLDEAEEQGFDGTLRSGPRRGDPIVEIQLPDGSTVVGYYRGPEREDNPNNQR